MALVVNLTYIIEIIFREIVTISAFFFFKAYVSI